MLKASAEPSTNQMNFDNNLFPILRSISHALHLESHKIWYTSYWELP